MVLIQYAHDAHDTHVHTYIYAYVNTHARTCACVILCGNDLLI